MNRASKTQVLWSHREEPRHERAWLVVAGLFVALLIAEAAVYVAVTL